MRRLPHARRRPHHHRRQNNRHAPTPRPTPPPTRNDLRRNRLLHRPRQRVRSQQGSRAASRKPPTPPSPPEGFANFQQWITGSQLEKKISLRDYSVSNRGLHSGLIGTPRDRPPAPYRLRSRRPAPSSSCNPLLSTPRWPASPPRSCRPNPPPAKGFVSFSACAKRRLRPLIDHRHAHARLKPRVRRRRSQRLVVRIEIFLHRLPRRHRGSAHGSTPSRTPPACAARSSHPRSRQYAAAIRFAPLSIV